MFSPRKSCLLVSIYLILSCENMCVTPQIFVFHLLRWFCWVYFVLVFFSGYLEPEAPGGQNIEIWQVDFEVSKSFFVVLRTSSHRVKVVY